ncbi:Bromodomain-containing protein [Cynara cardunculus var. scolymus]|uniref:Bromodomain-containing protein n=1 Tax=Cynara cardunculus var. scolymus TaxID=59895 RepID=A0A118K6A2_CYNCS|nr:Bromodomain-containing protein [Cynara cardunculus var. scolymus]
MGRILGGKKKGRPSNADLPRRNSSAEPESQPRRSCRRRNVRYNFDIDDYVDDEEFYKDVGRREKKLRMLLGEYDSDSNHCEESSSSDEYDEVKPSKKRKIDAGDREFDGEDDEIGETRGGKLEEEEEDDDAETGRANSVPGTPSDPPNGVFLPDKKTLELILDKLQKKDTYGVFAEPVDPDELPDYHAVIKQSMDFATVRKKLAKGTYLTLEQFEVSPYDVILICANAMQYNAPDTIYYKQASSILELAKTKFQRLNFIVDHPINSSSSPPKKQPKRSMVRTVQEPAGSDLSGEFQNVLSAHTKPPDDGNRRTTFNMSIQPVIESESVFSTFQGESKQLIPVGLHSDNSYTRSLARFAATLGSVAWKIASRRIEEALPEGIKFGPGWVGEYEPLTSPVLVIKNCTLKESDFLTRYLGIIDVRTDDKASRNTADGDEKLSRNPARKHESPKGSSSEMGPPSVSFLQAKLREMASSKHPQQNSDSLNLMELNASDIQSPRPAGVVSRNKNVSSVSYFKHPNRNDDGSVPQNWKPVSVVSDCNTIGSNVGPVNTSFPQQQGLADAVQMTSKLAQIHSNGSMVCPQRENPSNVEWMSLGGVTRPHVAENRNSHHHRRQHHVSPFHGEFPTSMAQLQQPVHGFVNEPRFQNRQVIFPRLVTADLSRFQVQSHWRAVSPQKPQQQPPRPKHQESRPPDLNIGYQSPVRQ